MTSPSFFALGEDCRLGAVIAYSAWWRKLAADPFVIEAPMSATPDNSSPAPEKKRTQIQDQDQPIDDATARDVVGGGLIVPCVRTIVPCIKIIIPCVKPIRGA